MNRALLLVGFSLPLVAAGCDGCNKSAPDAPMADAAPSPSGAPSAHAPLMATDGGGAAALPWAAIPSATANLLPNMGLTDRFQTEARSRPANLKMNVESVYAALTKAGLAVVDQQQHLAQTFGARYCVGARIGGPMTDKPAIDAGKGAPAAPPTQIYLSVCEFVSHEVAEMSKTYSSESLKIPFRVVHANAQTTLTVRGASDAPEIKALMDKALATYDAL